MSSFTTSGTENVMRWDRSSPNFMEVWYVTLNHAATGTGLWLRYTITAPKKQASYCEVWAFAFEPDGRPLFAGKNRYSIDLLGQSAGRDDGALVRIGGAWMSENHLEGEVVDGSRSLGWSLDLEPSARCFQHIPSALRGLAPRRASAVCSPNLSVPFFGTVKLDDRLLEFRGESGCQSHRWGRGHASAWAWGHCSSFGPSDAVFEGLAARTTLWGVPVPTQTFLFLSHRGHDLEFNQLKWALRSKSRFEMPTWAFTTSNDAYKIVGAARSRPDRMVQVVYEDPDGSRRHCVNTEVADMAIEVFRRSESRWIHDGSLTAFRTAHLEFGAEDVFPEVPISV